MHRTLRARFLARLIEEWALGSPHVVGPDVGTAAALFLAARTPERVTSLTIGGGAVGFPIEAGGALKDIIKAPSLDIVRGLDARANIGQAVEAAAASDSEPEVHEDYVNRLASETRQLPNCVRLAAAGRDEVGAELGQGARRIGVGAACQRPDRGRSRPKCADGGPALEASRTDHRDRFPRRRAEGCYRSSSLSV